MRPGILLGLPLVFLSWASAFNILPLSYGLEKVTARSSSTLSGVNSLRASAKPIYQAMEKKLTEGLQPIKLRIVDNSEQHAGHAGVSGRSGETHFEVLVVSDAFKGMRPVARHQLVYRLLDAELDKGTGGIHALQIAARTPEEESSAT